MITDTQPTIPVSALLRVELALYNRQHSDVARAVGVSIWTFSRILAGVQIPPPELVERIQRAIREGGPS